MCQCCFAPANSPVLPEKSSGAPDRYCLAKHNSLIINTKILPDKYPLRAFAAFTEQNLAKQYQPDATSNFTR
jgi:hypothetical protein